MLAEIKKMFTKVRKLITCIGIHNLRADTERLNVKRENGERGLIQQELTNKIAPRGLKKYSNTKTEWILHRENAIRSK